MISYDLIKDVFNLDNPLTLDYFELCSHQSNEQKDFERHHILPKSVCPEYVKSSWNIVKLSYQDHYAAHKMLPFILLSEEHKGSMLDAWHMMSNTRGKFAMHIAADDYAELKRLSRESKSVRYSGVNHPGYGIPRSQETRDKLAAINTGESSHRYGKKHSDETRKLMSSWQIGRKMTPEACINIGLAKLGIPHSEEHNNKIADALRGKPKTVEHIKNAADASRLYFYQQYSEDGCTLLNTFKRSELVNFGFSPACVSSVCSNRHKTHKGFIWKKIPKIVVDEKL